MGKDKGFDFKCPLHPTLIRVIIVNFYSLKLYYLYFLPLFCYVLYYDIFVSVVILFS